MSVNNPVRNARAVFQVGADGLPVIGTPTAAGNQKVTLVRGSDGQETTNSNTTVDSVSTSSRVGLDTVSFGHLYNNASWDRQRGNTEGTLLASAARTATTTSAVQTNHNARGVIVVVDVTVASGTGGLTPVIQGIDFTTGLTYNLLLASAALTTTGRRAYIVYPGAGAATGNVTQTSSFPLSRVWGVTIIAGDATSYTYSLGYSLIV